MELRTLMEGDLERLHAAYLEAFADYAVPAQPSLDALARLLVTRGALWERSIGAFDGERLVGFQMTALGAFGPDAVPTAYDVVTGIVPAWRGQGLAGRLFDAVRARLRPGEARRFVLEVLQSNAPAIAAYRRQGFHVTRTLECLRIPRSSAPPPPVPRGLRIAREFPPNRLPEGRDWSPDWHPSWQHTDAALLRAPEPPLVVCAREGARLVGYAAVFLSTPDLAHLAVRPTHRRRGVARALLSAAFDALPPDVPALRALNVQADAHADLAFLRAHGASAIATQFEMARGL